MIEAGEWGEKSNNSQTVKDYPIPHYAGSNKARCEAIWRKMIFEFTAGYGKNRELWGHKALWLCARKEAEQLKKVWNDGKWIICLRDPFVSFESQKNTFVKKQNLEEWIELWIKSYEFYKNNNSFLFQIDKISKEDYSTKKETTDSLLKFLNLQPTEETDKFVSEWSVVHKACSEDMRSFKLGDKRRNGVMNSYPVLDKYMKDLGYKND
jgi:hypothetical protein